MKLIFSTIVNVTMTAVNLIFTFGVQGRIMFYIGKYNYIITVGNGPMKTFHQGYVM